LKPVIIVVLPIYFPLCSESKVLEVVTLKYIV